MKSGWKPPSDWLKITTIDAHTAGEPLRIITDGLPAIPGDSILEKRRFVQNNLENIRTALMWEPRGHADMYGCILTEPVTSDGHFGVLFLHNEGYSTMCGHAIIALTSIGLDTGLIKITGQNPVVKIDSPAGRILAYAQRRNGKVTEVSFHNVPSFVYAMDQEINVPGLGIVQFDIVYGGAFYAFCRAKDLGLEIIPEQVPAFIEKGKLIKNAVKESMDIKHPFEHDLGFLYGTIFTGAPHDKNHHSRNVCVFAEGEVDRSPTGTGVSARAALLYAKGEIKQGEPFEVESILGTCFTGRVKDTTIFGSYPAVIPEITGSAYITGQHEFFIDPQDPLRKGFILR